MSKKYVVELTKQQSFTSDMQNLPKVVSKLKILCLSKEEFVMDNPSKYDIEELVHQLTSLAKYAEE